jgi:hypothetical protein
MPMAKNPGHDHASNNAQFCNTFGWVADKMCSARGFLLMTPLQTFASARRNTSADERSEFSGRRARPCCLIEIDAKHR